MKIHDLLKNNLQKYVALSEQLCSKLIVRQLK